MGTRAITRTRASTRTRARTRARASTRARTRARASSEPEPEPEPDQNSNSFRCNQIGILRTDQRVRIRIPDAKSLMSYTSDSN